MSVNSVLDLRHSTTRWFSFQTKDHGFVLYQDLPSAYLISLAVDKIGFTVDQFVLDYVYPFEKYINRTKQNLDKYPEEYYLFNLENYYHSVDFALGFVEGILETMALLQNPKKVILHTFKTPEDECLDLINKYSFIKCIVRTDLEYFYNELFFKKKDIATIPNVIYRDDAGIVHCTPKEDISYDLSEYIVGAYYNGYYMKYPKVKDQVISLIDEDNQETTDLVYDFWPKKKYIDHFRYRPQTEIMLTTGRGCKYKCTYCYRGVKYSSVRQIPLDILKKDLDYLKEYGYEYVYFYDDCFLTTNYNRMDELIALLASYDFEYGIAARYEMCSSEVLEKLATLRLQRIQIGLQSTSLEVNKETKRGFKKERFQKTIENMTKNGINVSLDIILGLPGEGVKGFLTTFNYALTLKPVSIFINTLFLNPGTELYENKEKSGIITKQDFYSKRPLFKAPGIHESSNFSFQDLQIARRYVGYYVKKTKDTLIILR